MSSNPRENSINYLEKALRQNQYMHHKFQPKLQAQHNLSFVSYINTSQNKKQQSMEQCQNFLKSLDPKHARSMDRKASQLKFNFDSIEEKQFKRERERFKNNSLLQTFEGNMSQDTYVHRNLHSLERVVQNKVIEKSASIKSNLGSMNNTINIEDQNSNFQTQSIIADNGRQSSLQLVKGRQTQEDQQQKMRLLNTVSSAVDNFIKIKYLNKKSSHDEEMEKFKRNFKSYVKYDPIKAVNKRMDDLRRGKEMLDENYNETSPQKLSPSRFKKVEQLLSEGLPNFSEQQKSILYLPPVRTRLNQSVLDESIQKMNEHELIKQLNDKLKSRSRLSYSKKLINQNSSTYQIMVDNLSNEELRISNSPSPTSKFSRNQQDFSNVYKSVPASIHKRGRIEFRNFNNENLKYDQSSALLPDSQQLYINESQGTIEHAFDELDEIDKNISNKLKNVGLNENFETYNKRNQIQSQAQLYKKLLNARRRQSVLNQSMDNQSIMKFVAQQNLKPFDQRSKNYGNNQHSTLDSKNTVSQNDGENSSISPTSKHSNKNQIQSRLKQSLLKLLNKYQSINQWKLNKILQQCDQGKLETDKDTASLERITYDQKQMYEALLKYKDVIQVSKSGLKFTDVLEDIKYDERNIKELAKDSLKKFNEAFQ
eukprot:403360530